MPIHPHGQRFDPLQKEERIERADARTDIAKTFDAGANYERDGSEHFAEFHAVIGRRRLVDLREGALLPRELAAIDDGSADAVSVASHELRQRMDHDVGAVVDGAAQ